MVIGKRNTVEVSSNACICNGDLTRITTNRKYRAPGKHCYQPIKCPDWITSNPIAGQRLYMINPQEPRLFAKL